MSEVLLYSCYPEPGILLLGNQRQHQNLARPEERADLTHMCLLLCSVSAALASFSWMDSISTFYYCYSRHCDPPSAVLPPGGVSVTHFVQRRSSNSTLTQGPQAILSVPPPLALPTPRASHHLGARVLLLYRVSPLIRMRPTL